MVRTQIQVHPEQIKWLKKQALASGVSMAQLIRDSIELYRRHAEKARLLNSRKKDALNAVGRFSSGEEQPLG